MQLAEHEPLSADEQAVMRKIVHMLADQPALLSSGTETVELPKVVSEALRQIVLSLAHNQETVLVELGPIVNFHKAAIILSVTEERLAQLMEEGEILFQEIADLRRFHVRDLVAYMKRRQIRQGEATEEIARLARKWGYTANRRH